MGEASDEKLWEHQAPELTRTAEFRNTIRDKYMVDLVTYEDLRLWSINHLNKFWEEVWYFTGVKASTPFTKVGYEVYSAFVLKSFLTLMSILHIATCRLLSFSIPPSFFL